MSETALTVGGQGKMEEIVQATVAGCIGQTRRVYAAHIRNYLARHRSINRVAINAYLAGMQERGAGSSVVNQALAALKKLAEEAYHQDAITDQVWHSIKFIRGLPKRGVRLGNWLTGEQVEEVLKLPDRTTVKGKRDAMILALLIGCGLRREELCSLVPAQVQQRDGRMVLVDVVGKGRRIRTIGVPEWAEKYVEEYLPMADEGCLVGLTHCAIWYLVKRYAERVGVPELAPHDLRRTYAALSRDGGADMVEIQDQLGHANMVTTQQYMKTVGKFTRGTKAGDYIKVRT